MSNRRDFVLSLPFVSKVKKPERCDAYVHPPVSLYFGGRAPSTARSQNLEDYRCKNAGTYRFKALKRSYASDGSYCWSHLVSHLTEMQENDRVNRYWKKWREEHPS